MNHKLDPKHQGEGTFLCRNCGGFEGSLATHCPDREITPEESEAIYDGTLDFVDGVWLKSADG